MERYRGCRMPNHHTSRILNPDRLDVCRKHTSTGGKIEEEANESDWTVDMIVEKGSRVRISEWKGSRRKRCHEGWLIRGTIIEGRKELGCRARLAVNVFASLASNREHIYIRRGLLRGASWMIDNAYFQLRNLDSQLLRTEA